MKIVINRGITNSSSIIINISVKIKKSYTVNPAHYSQNFTPWLQES